MACFYCDPPAAAPYCARCRRECTRVDPCGCCYASLGARPHNLATDILAAYEARVAAVRASWARERDAAAQRSHEFLELMLSVMDATMADEDVPARTRQRVLTAVVYAAVTPPELVEADRDAREHQTVDLHVVEGDYASALREALGEPARSTTRGDSDG